MQRLKFRILRFDALIQHECDTVCNTLKYIDHCSTVANDAPSKKKKNRKFTIFEHAFQENTGSFG